MPLLTPDKSSESRQIEGRGPRPSAPSDPDSLGSCSWWACGEGGQQEGEGPQLVRRGARRGKYPARNRASPHVRARDEARRTGAPRAGVGAAGHWAGRRSRPRPPQPPGGCSALKGRCGAGPRPPPSRERGRGSGSRAPHAASRTREPPKRLGRGCTGLWRARGRCRLPRARTSASSPLPVLLASLLASALMAGRPCDVGRAGWAGAGAPGRCAERGETLVQGGKGEAARRACAARGRLPGSGMGVRGNGACLGQLAERGRRAVPCGRRTQLHRFLPSSGLKSETCAPSAICSARTFNCTQGGQQR